MDVSYRKEIKYIIPIRQFKRMQKKISAYLRPDENLADGFYKVRTLYFDTAENSDLFSSVFGDEQKSKIRLRMYPPKIDDIKLELKEKYGHDGLKTYVNISKEEAQSMVKSRYSFLLEKNEDAALRIYEHLTSNAYSPKSMVEYKRTAYYLPAGRTRITFDYDIRTIGTFRTFFNDTIMAIPTVENDIGVLEIKYNSVLLGVIKDVLRDIDATSEANSKYVQSRLLF